MSQRGNPDHLGPFDIFGLDTNDYFSISDHPLQVAQSGSSFSDYLETAGSILRSSAPADVATAETATPSSIIPDPGVPGIAANVAGTVVKHGRYTVISGHTLFGDGLPDQFYPIGQADVLIYDDTYNKTLTNDGALWNAAEGSHQVIGVLASSFVWNAGKIVSEVTGGDEFSAAVGVYNIGGDLNNTGEIYGLTDNGLAAGVYGAVADTINYGLIAARADNGTAVGILREDSGGVVNNASGVILAEGMQATGVFIGSYAHVDSKGDEDLVSPTVQNDGLIGAVSLDPDAPSIGIEAVGQEAFALNFVNSGVIIADFAIYSAVDSLTGNPYTTENVVNQNGGLIEGIIYLGEGHDSVTNKGTIEGVVALGGGDDTMRDAGGRLVGIADLGFGADRFAGGAGAETVLGNRDDDNLNGGGGKDILLGGYGDDTLNGGASSDSLYGEWGNDVILGGAGDKIDGGAGDDRIVLSDFGGFAGIEGGAGFDTLVLPGASRILDLKLAIADGTLNGIDSLALGKNLGLVVRPADVAELSDAENLTVQADASNHVYLVGGWTEGGEKVVGGQTYRTFDAGSDQLLVQLGATVTINHRAPAVAVGFDPAPAALPVAPDPSLFSGSLTVGHGFEMFSDFTVYDNEVWQSDNGLAPILNEGFVLTNRGTIESITDTHDNATAVSSLGMLENYGHIIASATSTAVPTTVTAIEDGGLRNFGTIEAYSASGVATGMYSFASDINLRNNGTISAQSDASSDNPIGHMAVGLKLHNPGLVNTGTIDATGAGAAAVVMELPSFRLANSGTITATTNDGHESVGILNEGLYLTNSGTIHADIAVEVSFSDAANVHITNTGMIEGRIECQASNGDPVALANDEIDNSGTINGRIDLGIDNDSYNGTLGHQSGGVFGQDGSDTLIGGVDNDVLDGGAGNDFLTGGLGADLLTGGDGVDRFIYASARDSTGLKYDTITDFDAAADKIDLATTVSSIDGAVITGSLSSGSFNAGLAAAIGSSALSAHGAVLFTPDSGNEVGKTFLVVDLNGTAGYQAGKDLVIELDHLTNGASLSVHSFV